MPDGDYIYGALPQHFEGVYKSLCEGRFESATIANDFINPMRLALKQLGDGPLHFLSKAAVLFQDLPAGLLTRTVDFRQIMRDLEMLAYDTRDYRKRALQLALNSAKSRLHILRDRASVPTYSLLVRDYISSVFQAEFIGRLSLESHAFHCSSALFDERLHEARIHLDATFTLWADHAVRAGTFANHHSSRQGLTPITATTDLLAMT